MPFDAATTPDLTARATSIVAAQVAARATHPKVGVCFSGMGHDAPAEIETVEAVMARLERKEAEIAAFRASPKGRFQAAALTIWRATGDSRLLDCLPPGGEVRADRAAKLLASMSGPAADDARKALADFLCGQMVSA